jgi:ubiquinone/menaquinone biosynthesis C-methylase UbiE/uncharacterized protein YbaR (Trm112 family)
VYAGFRREHIQLLRCPGDGSELELIADGNAPPLEPIKTGVLCCAACERNFPIESGIAILLPKSYSNEDSLIELSTRDRMAASDDLNWETSDWSRAEMLPTLRSVGSMVGKIILELGTGCGRYTTFIAREAAQCLAVDFSVDSLKRLAVRLSNESLVSLVCADIAQFRLRNRSFDIVFSTLVSNLPDGSQRLALYRLVASVLKSDGRFVFSAHHYGLRERLTRQQKSGYYSTVRIYRQLFLPNEIRAEMVPYFDNIRCDPIQIYFPLSARFGIPLVAASEFA